MESDPHPSKVVVTGIDLYTEEKDAYTYLMKKYITYPQQKDPYKKSTPSKQKTLFWRPSDVHNVQKNVDSTSK